MAVSKLATSRIMSPNHYDGRQHGITRITPHHMAGNLTVEQCGAVFSSSARQASSNYGIGTDGRISCYVDEANAAWTSSNYDNDNRAVTIEVANTAAGARNGTWEVSDKAWASLVALCADICRRNGIARLEYTGDARGNLTEHRMFAPTGCPGPYLHARMGRLAREANAILEGGDDVSDAYDYLSAKVDPTGRGKKSDMRTRLAYMAEKQERMQASIDSLAGKIEALAKKLG